MLLNIAIAAFMMVATTAIHAGGMVLALRMIRFLEDRRGRLRLRFLRSRIYWLVGTVLLMFLISVVEVLAWSAAYLALNAIQGFERALYFSTVTFTTLGYGDIVIDEHWRLLASFEATNGIIMFGWTTAIVVATVQRIYRKEYMGNADNKQ